MTDQHATFDYTRPILAEVQNSVIALQPCLKSAIETGDDSAWREVDHRLQVITDTLSVVNLRGARLLAEEIQALVTTRVADSSHSENLSTNLDVDQSAAVDVADQAKTVVHSSDVQQQLLAANNTFVDYLDYLLAGNADRILALVPLVNNLRACRLEPLLSESIVAADAFGIQSSLQVHADATNAVQELASELRKVRLPLMQSILQVFRIHDPEISHSEAADVMGEVTSLLDQLQQAGSHDSLEPLNSLWSLVQAVCLSIGSAHLQTDITVRQLLVQSGRYVAVLQDSLDSLVGQLQANDVGSGTGGDAGRRIDLPERLIRNLLYYVAYSQSEDPRVSLIRERYKLDQLLPHNDTVAPVQKLSHALDRSIIDNLLHEVSQAQILVEEHAETGLKTTQQLLEAATRLQQVAAGFLLLGEVEPEKQSHQAAEIFNEIADLPDPSQMQQLATVLLLLREQLQQLQQDGGRVRLFAGSFNSDSIAEGATERNLSTFRMDRTIFRCVDEARAQLAFIEQAYLHRFEMQLQELAGQDHPDLQVADSDARIDSAEETLSATAVVVRAPQKRSTSESLSFTDNATAMDSAARALMIIPLPEAVPPFATVSRYLRWCDELSDESGLPPQLHVAFADLVVNLSHYLEATVRGQAVSGDLLQNTEIAMQWIDGVLESNRDNTTGNWGDLNYDAASIRSPFNARMRVDPDAAFTENIDLRTVHSDRVDLPVSIHPWGSGEDPARPIAVTEVTDVHYETPVRQTESRMSGAEKYTATALQHFGSLGDHLSAWRQYRDPSALQALQQEYLALEVISVQAGVNNVVHLCRANGSLLQQLIDKQLPENELRQQLHSGLPDADRLLQESIAVLPQLLNETADRGPTTGSTPTNNIVKTDNDNTHTGVIGLDELLVRIESFDGLPDAKLQTGLHSDITSNQTTAPHLTESRIPAETSNQIDKTPSGDLLGNTLAITSDGLNDSTLFDVFRHECAGHIATLKGVAETAQSTGSSVPISERFARTLHTLNGSALAAEEAGIATLATALEARIDTFRRTSSALSDSDWRIVSETVDHLADALEAREAGADAEGVDHIVQPAVYKLNHLMSSTGGDQSTPFGGLDDAHDSFDVTADLSGQYSTTDAVGDLSQHSNKAHQARHSLFLTFVDEADEILHRLQKMNDALSEPGALQHLVLRDALRQLHTLKGSARVAGCEPMAVLAHQIEHHWLDWRHSKSSLTSRRLDLFLASVDALQINLEQARNGQPMGDFSLLLDELADDSQLASGNMSTSTDTDDTLELLRNEASDNASDRTAEFDSTLDMSSYPEMHANRDLSLAADGDQNKLSDNTAYLSELDDLTDSLAEAIVSDAHEDTLENTAESTAFVADELTKDARSAGNQVVNAGDDQSHKVDRRLLERLHSLATRISLQQADLHQGLSQLRDNLLDLDKSSIMLRQKLRDLDLETSLLPALSGHASLTSRAATPATLRPDDLAYDPLANNKDDGNSAKAPASLATEEDSRQLSEVLHDLDTIRDALHNRLRLEEETLAQTSRLASEIHETVLKARLVRFETLTHRLQSVVRQAGHTLRKEVSFRMSGGDINIDRDIHTQMAAPLEHLLRNAVVHGIEKPELRETSGKPAVGLVQLDVRVSGNLLEIDIKDDGGGVDFARLRELSGDASLDDGALLERLPLEGLSTRTHTDELAGRGVGLGTASQLLSRLNGSLQFKSSNAFGTLISVRVPLQVQLQRAVVFTLNNFHFAVPAELVTAVRPLPEDPDDASAVQMRTSYPLCDLSTLLGIQTVGDGVYPDTARQLLESTGNPLRTILVESDGKRFSLRPQRLIGYRDLVTRSPGQQLSSLGIYSGVSLQSDGTQIMLLDTVGLLKSLNRATVLDSDQQSENVQHAVTMTRFGNDLDVYDDGAESVDLDDTQHIPAEMQSRRAARLFVDALDFGAEHTTTNNRQEDLHQTIGSSAENVEPCVMIVDDSVTLRTYTREIVTSAGVNQTDQQVPFRSIEARDGLEALQALKHMQYPPALLIVDVEMPRMDGFQLVAALRQIERYKNLPVVMISSRTGTSYRHRANKLGVVAYLGKPYQAHELTRIMQSLGIAKKQQQQPVLSS